MIYWKQSNGPSASACFFDDEEKLYDREPQEEQLLEAYKRRISKKPKNNEIVLLNGKPGSGKSALAKRFRNQVESATPPGIFISGKFDQLRQHADVPYAPIVAAFEQFTEYILAQGPEPAENMKEIIEVVMGSELGTLVQVLPCLKRLLDHNSNGNAFPDDGTGSIQSDEVSGIMQPRAAGNQHRIVVILRRFIRAICCSGGSDRRPLVLFLDDLHWADFLSLDLIDALCRPSIDNNQGLMVIGSCRGEEIEPFAPLSILLRDLEERGTIITEVLLSNLAMESVIDIIEDMTDLPLDQCSVIAGKVYEQTNGNPLFVKQYLWSLEENSILYEDVNDGVWVFRESITMDLDTDDDACLDHLVDRMKKLPMDVQEVLSSAACLGSEFQGSILYQALGGDFTSNNQVRQALNVAVDKGLIEYDPGDGVGHFKHDIIQEAAIVLIGADEKAAFYLRLGRNLQNCLQNTKEFKKTIAIVANLILNGKDEIESQAEKESLALLCLQVGRHMAKSSAFSSAIVYVEEGVKLLSRGRWQDQYDLRLALLNNAAELAYCIGDHTKVDNYVDEVTQNAVAFEHKLSAYTTQILSLGSRGLSGRAAALGVHVLVRLGEPRPKRVRKMDVMIGLFKVKRMLRGKTDEEILNLPTISNPKALGLMCILHVLYPILLVSHIEYTTVISFRLISLTLQYGLCSYASVGFAFYGSVLARMGKVCEGYRYGELALRIIEKYPTKELLARSLLRVALNLRIFKEPFRTSLGTIMESHRLGLSTGDIETSMWAANAACNVRVHNGEPLPAIVKSLRGYIALCGEYKQSAIGLYNRPVLQFCLNLMGYAAGSPLVLTGEAMNEKKMLEQARAEHNTGLVSLILHLKCHLAVYLNEFHYATSLSADIKKSTKLDLPLIPILSFLGMFLEGIVAIEMARTCKRPSIPRQRNIRAARKRLKKLKGASLHCPENMMNKVHLLEAELAVCNGNYEKAISKYKQSIVFAEHEGFVHEHALACEKLARMLRDCCGRANESESCFEKARDLYKQYGAKVLEDRMTREIENCRVSCSRVGVTKQGRGNLLSLWSEGPIIPRISDEDFAFMGY